MFTTLAPSAKGCLSSHHGARQSSTTTTSAAASPGPGAAPTWQGCSVEHGRCVAHHEQPPEPQAPPQSANTTKSVGEGMSVSVRVTLGCRRLYKKKNEVK